MTPSMQTGFVVVAALGMPSCLFCGGPDCIEFAQVTLRSQAANWASGVYEVAISASGRTHECTVVSPDDFASSQSSPELCTPRLPFRVVARYEAGELSAYVLEADFRSAPERVAVVVRRDGVEILNSRRDFEYKTTYEHGPFCGPDCAIGRVELTIP